MVLVKAAVVVIASDGDSVSVTDLANTAVVVIASDGDSVSDTV